MNTPYQRYTQDLKGKGLHRTLDQLQASMPQPVLPEGRIRRGVEEFANFSSNDYLGLSKHRQLRQRAIVYAQQWGVGATASRLMAGSLGIFEDIENKIAAAIGTESALIFNSGYQGNVTVLQALLDKDVLGAQAIVFADRLNHSSLIQGIRLAGAKMWRYPHLDLNHLEMLLKKAASSQGPRFIVSETLFGMDGDTADIPGLIALAKKYDAFLYLDDAHAVGVYGKNGFGLASDYADQVDLILGTFGKAMGSFGAYVATSQQVRDYLINKCPGFMYSTALPPPIIGCIDAAIDLVPQMSIERAKLQSYATYVRSALKGGAWNLGKGNTHIIPVIVGCPHKAKTLQRQLERQEILCVAVRPPTVPVNTSRLRISLTAAHSAAQLEQLAQVLLHLSDKPQEQAVMAA